jgi:beta-galactosidase
MTDSRFRKLGLLGLLSLFLTSADTQRKTVVTAIQPGQTEWKGRERICIDDGWKFMRYSTAPDSLVYDTRPAATDKKANPVADARPNESAMGSSQGSVLKNWILPSANDLIGDETRKHARPTGNPGGDFPFVKNDFNDSGWESVELPHDWAIKGPFYKSPDAAIGGGMGRLPCQGVAWYRRKLDIPATDSGRCIYLDIDGAMSYAMVWLNGILVGGWPYGYNSFRLDLTPYLKCGDVNQLAIRLDNPASSSRWYPGAGIYRNVWLVKTSPVHVAHWGSEVSCTDVSATSAMVNLGVTIENKSVEDQRIDMVAELYALNPRLEKAGPKVMRLSRSGIRVGIGQKLTVKVSGKLVNPLLWGPAPSQQPHLYVAVTRLYRNGGPIDEYETHFGIREVHFDPLRGLLVNGHRVRIQGVNQHHDQGALGSAFNPQAAARQLDLLRTLGCNAIRMAHNPPDPELLDLTDRMGFLVLDELFDCWAKGKTPLDFHLIFPDWYEPDTRAFIRRDRNHPSVIAWSIGNEVGEQYTGGEGAALAKELHDIVREEDSTRPVTASMNYAKPDMPFAAEMDMISLNYQGEGIRDAPAYAGLKGISTPPLYPAFHERFPDKLILSSETASSLSSRGTYTFPVYAGISAPVSDSAGGDPRHAGVSAYELYTAPFGSSPDKVFASQDQHPYVAGEFVWSGWDYLGEPTPYYSARSSYSGIIDLAGFPKDRFYLYQSRWRPDLPMAHILPHWTWPDRIGKITPVHVFSSGDEAELFLNGRSLGKRKKKRYEYRFRWDSVVYQPGVLKVVAYKKGRKWATHVIRTAGTATRLRLTEDRNSAVHSAPAGVRFGRGDQGLLFVTVRVEDAGGVLVPEGDPFIQFEVSDGAEVVAMDNGDPADLTSFVSIKRKAFHGLALAVIRVRAGFRGKVVVTARSGGLVPGRIVCPMK